MKWRLRYETRWDWSVTASADGVYLASGVVGEQVGVVGELTVRHPRGQVIFERPIGT